MDSTEFEQIRRGSRLYRSRWMGWTQYTAAMGPGPYKELVRRAFLPKGSAELTEAIEALLLESVNELTGRLEGS